MRKVMKVIKEAEEKMSTEWYTADSVEVVELIALIESLKQDPNDMRTLGELLNDLYK